MYEGEKETLFCKSINQATQILKKREREHSRCVRSGLLSLLLLEEERASSYMYMCSYVNSGNSLGNNPSFYTHRLSVFIEHSSPFPTFYHSNTNKTHRDTHTYTHTHTLITLHSPLPSSPHLSQAHRLTLALCR